MGVAFDELADLIRSRRTSMLVDREREVPLETIRQLCELAQWAPNHKRTWPWRFAAFVGDGRARLGETISEAMERHGDEPSKVAKARGKYLRTPAAVVIGAAPGDSQLRTAENRDSVAAGHQNMLLAATALGLASYWGSCPKGTNDAVVELCGFEPGTTIVSITYLGWATSSVEPPTRPAARLEVIGN